MSQNPQFLSSHLQKMIFEWNFEAILKKDTYKKTVVKYMSEYYGSIEVHPYI